jgi:TRAP-type C4-dicarboxylate transport system substrate-binding protein
MKRVLVLLLGLVALAGCGSSASKVTGGAPAAKAVVLTLANPHTGDMEIGEWTRAVERLSGGAIRIEVTGDWRVGEVEAERGTLEDVRAGKVDLARIPTRAWDTFGVDSFQALEAPLLVDSLALQQRVLTGPLGAAMLDGVRAVGVEPVGLLPGSPRRPVGVTRDLLEPADYRGARIGVRPSAIHEATMRALGARVERIAGVQGLDGLDGTETDFLTVDFARYDQQARSMTANVALWPRAVAIVINRDAWERLSHEQQAILTDASSTALGEVMRREGRYERGGPEATCSADFTLVRARPSAVAALRRAVAPVYRQLERDAVTGRAIEEIEQIKATLPGEPVPTCDRQRGGVSGPIEDRLVGRWQAMVTYEELQAARREPGEATEDNWGRVTLALGANGEFELLNDRFRNAAMAYGKWSSRSEVLTFTTRGDLATGAAETWRYRWTLFRGALTLEKLCAESRGANEDCGPTALTVAPLTLR